MLDRFWDERIEDFDLRAKVSMDDTLGVDEVRGVLQQVAQVTEGLSGRSLMQLMNGACTAKHQGTHTHTRIKDAVLMRVILTTVQQLLQPAVQARFNSIACLR